MHACRVTSESATRARLEAKRSHAERKPHGKPEQRQWKQAKREFRAELAFR